MSAPNLNGSGLTVTAAVDRTNPANNTPVSLTSNAAASGHTYITLSLTVANKASSGLPFRIDWFDGTNDNYLMYDGVVPGNAQMEVTPTRKLLLEGWTLKVVGENTQSLFFVHTYLDCS